jgi:hypothetical protein
VRHSLDSLSPALVSDDLSITGRRGDADYVAALGYASMTYPIASPLIRMYLSHDRASVHEARAKAMDMARKAARRSGIRLSKTELMEVGNVALDLVVNKACPRCHGTRYELIAGSTCLGTKPCKGCDGTGRRIVPTKHRKLINEIVAKIERIESTIDAIVGKRV